MILAAKKQRRADIDAAHSEGVEAARVDIFAAENPYPEGSRLRQAWDFGLYGLSSPRWLA